MWIQPWWDAMGSMLDANSQTACQRTGPDRTDRYATATLDAWNTSAGTMAAP